MKTNLFLLSIVLTLVLAFPAHAQEIEIHPFGGAVFPSSIADSADFKDVAVFGVRWSVFLIPQFSYEAAFARQSHFEFEGTDPRSTAFIWEINGVYHPGREVPGGEPRKVAPFVTVGVGLLSVDLEDGRRYFLIDGDTVDVFPFQPVLTDPTLRAIEVDDGDLFFTFNYGGGVKASKLWGPVGVRFDVRGRTAPNMFGSAGNFVETTGGITFTWGE